LNIKEVVGDEEKEEVANYQKADTFGPRVR